MRWVWRAEHGGFKIEYAALVLLVATVAVSVFAFGLPSDIRNLYAEGMCRFAGDEGCTDAEGGGAEQNGTEQNGTDRADGSGEGGADGEGSADGEGGDGAADQADLDPSGDGGDGDDWVNPADEILAQYDSDAAQEYADAQEELAQAEQDLADAGYDEAFDALIELVGDIIGYNDAKACITEGDIMACIWTVVGFTPWGKGAKLLKNSAKIIKLWNRFRKAKKARDAASRAVSTAQGKLDTLVSKVTSSCRTSSFLPRTGVLMADGTTMPISLVEVGDLVMAADPATGERTPQPVTAIIGDYDEKELVTLTFDSGRPGLTASGGLTATGGHPFWSESDQRWTDARDLAPGDTIIGADGERSTVTSTRTEWRPQQVNNLSVGGPRTYFVSTGSGSALVHNCELQMLSGPGRPFKTPNGLVFKDRNYRTGQQHSLQHVLEHSADTSDKARDRMRQGQTHSKFKQDGNALQTLDDAWGKRNGPDVKTVANGNKTTYWIPMGTTVGDDGEKIVKIVVENGKEVVTAFPVKSKTS